MATDPIVTTTDLSAYQGGDAETLLEQATALVRAYCGWHVTPEITETVTVPGSGVRVQILRTLRVVSINSVTYAGVALAADDYEWAPEGVLTLLPEGPYFSQHCGAPTGDIAVTMNHGYAYLPDVAAVVLSIASRSQRIPASGATQETAGPFQRTYSQITPGVAGGMVLFDHEKAILDHYRLHPRP